MQFEGDEAPAEEADPEFTGAALSDTGDDEFVDDDVALSDDDVDDDEDDEDDAPVADL